MSLPAARDRRRAMAGALTRAAEHLEHRASQLDAQVAQWRKDRPGDDTPTVARTLHDVARQLRRWAADCVFGEDRGAAPSAGRLPAEDADHEH